MEAYIIGEDQVTKFIIKRILNFCTNKFSKIHELPARGGKIKSQIYNYNILSNSNPTVLLTDLDSYDCAPTLLNILLNGINKNKDFHIRVAVDEAEAWLMADRKGFSNFFQVHIDKIPLPKVLSRLKPNIKELDFPYKSSLYFIREIIPFSKNKDLISSFTPREGAKKGPEYNISILPFIDYWNINEAMSNSYSLERTINRLKII